MLDLNTESIKFDEDEDIEFINAESIKVDEDIEFIKTLVRVSNSLDNLEKNEKSEFRSQFPDAYNEDRDLNRGEKAYADLLSKHSFFLEDLERTLYSKRTIKHYQDLEKRLIGITRGAKVRVIRKSSYWFNQIGTVITAESENRELYYGISVRFDNVNYSGLTSNNYCLEDLELV